ISRLIKYLLAYKKKIFLLLILSLLVSVTGLAYPFLMGEIVKNVQDSRWGDLYLTGVILLIIVTINFFLKWIYQREMGYLSILGVSAIRTDLFLHIQKLSLRFYTARPSGKILSILTNDVESVNNLVSNAVIQFIGDLITVVITVIGIFVISWQLTLFILMLSPLIGGVLYFFAKKSREYWRRTRQTISLITSLLQEAISGSKTIKAFVTEDQNIENFNLANLADKDLNLSAAKLQAFLSPIIQLLIAFAVGLVLVRGADLVKAGELTIPTLVTYTLLLVGFMGPFGNIANFYNTLQLALAGGERILTIIDTKPEIVEIENPIKLDIKGEIEYNHVYFWYKEGIPVLKDINLKTKPNMRVAFVGFTGAGKTTLVSLLSRFYDPQKGYIAIDGVNLKDLDLDYYRSQMGIVLQDTYLFTGTVMDNIRYGKPNATDEEVIAAAKKVGAHEFIMKLEDGYNTQVRERGSLLSVGQRQLISFSRALLADPKILILDEATSSVDPYTEIKIQEALEKLLKNRNSFIIAHRLSTILNSDLICVLENGKIIQKGTHDELVKQEGLYKHLYEMQFKKPGASLDELKKTISKDKTEKEFVRT
ncbi:MAG: ABC transporter ATP-binding protein, partial [Promethearchaeota archaeon]